MSIGLSSNFRALGGHWFLLATIFAVAVVSKLFGCGMAALAMGMGTVRSFRVGCGMISRGSVGLIVMAMGASTGIFNEPEVAVMVAVVLLISLINPLIMWGAFAVHCPQDLEEPTSVEETEEPVDATEWSMINVQAEARAD